MNLEQIRTRIDQLDREIARLLTERMEITNEVAAYKKANNLPIYHPEREQQVIDKVCALTEEVYRPALQQIYHCIMDESKKNQQRFFEAQEINHPSEEQ